MAAYVITEIETTDGALMAEYRALAPSIIAAHGGRYLVRGGACETLEGGWVPERIAVLEFESMEQAKAWWSSAEYADPKAMRQRAGLTRMILVEGLAEQPV